MATPLRLLILEDNPSDAELMLHELRGAGYDPIADRVETEQEYRKHLQPAPEIVLADFSMPEFNALRALEIMQECQLDIPVIIVSVAIGEERAVQIMQRGATDYIIKDRMGRLGHAVTQALEQKRLREANRRAEQALRESEELSRKAQEAQQREQEASKQARERTLAMNEALTLGSLRQHELTEAAEKLNEQLRTEMAERKKAEEALRKADYRKDEFLAMLAHELRNPLAPIKNAAHILRVLNSDNAIVNRAQRIIERQANHLAKLVDDLLDIARIQKGKFQLRKEHLDLGKTISRAVESCEHLIHLQDHTISVEIQSNPPIHIDADPTRVDQILVNLISNAAKYTPSQGSIKISAALEQGMAVVRVRDNGVGIEPEMLKRIFDVFTQVEQSVERSQGGLGLGLKLVKELAEMHGGFVEAKSEGLNKGSEFIVRLPALEKSDSKLIAAVAIPGFRGSSKRILVVDDNVDNRETMEMVLTMSGHSVELAEDGLQAVQKALQTHPDVVFLDIGLPKMNGYDAAREIRNHPEGADIVLIAVSGYGQAEDKRKALDAGFDEHLTKPVETGAIDKILNELESFRRSHA